MRSAGNFHPEWGYFAPLPSFRRTLRIAVIAAAIGATAGVAVGISLLSSSRSNVYNGSIAAHALTSNMIATPSPAAIANTTGNPADTAPPALALLSPETDGPIQIAPASDVSRVAPAQAANPEQELVPARKSPARVHRLRMAHAAKHLRRERGFARPFQLPHNSMFVQLNEPCCGWTMAPTQRNAPQW